MSLVSADERLLEAKKGIVVPGGVVTIDPYRGRPSVVVWAKLLLSVFWRSYFAAERMERDIVVHDETRKRELYREGPYNEITVTQPLERLLSEIRSSGLEAFLRTRQVAASQIGPLDVPSRVGLWGQMSPYLPHGKKGRT
jgi:hypothetical protein